MPPSIAVELQPYTPEWANHAAREIELISPAFGENLLTIHHIGSTSIPGISAKPILDLMPIVLDLSVIDDCRPAVEALGYDWWGEFGILGRRYCTRTDAATRRRKVHLHCFQNGMPGVERHLAFRDYLRSHVEIAQEYDRLKAHCRELHPFDSYAYSDCKSEWIRAVEFEALASYRAANR